MGHNSVPTIPAFLYGLNARYPCVCPGRQAARGPAPPHLSFLVARCQHRVFYLHIGATDVSSLPPPSAPGATPRCGTEIPLYFVHVIPPQALHFKLVCANWGPGRIRNIPVPLYANSNYLNATDMDELPVICIPRNCISHSLSKSCNALQKKG